MIDPAFEILNQRGTPMFFSDVFANRPTAGIVGRIFISTDTYAFYRDTGSGWDLIGGPGTGTITGSGTIGTLPIWNGTQVIGDSSLLEGSTKFTTTKDFQADGYYLSGMTAGSGALYWTSDRVTLANYNATGNVVIEAGGGQNAQTISGTNLSTTFYGNIIRNGGLSTQFLKADGSLDSNTYNTGSGAASQVAFWSGTNALSGENNLWWDSVNNHFGINTNTPGTAIDVHHDQSTIMQLNQTTGTNDTRIAFQNSGAALWRIGNFYNAGANDWGIYDVIGAIQPLTIAKTTGQTFIGSKTTASGRLVVNSASSDAHIQVVGANAPSIRIDNAGTGATQRFVMGLATATNNFIQGSTAGDICISTASASPLLFGMWQTINASEVMRISTANNVIVGSSVDSGYKFSVTGTGRFTGIVTFGSTGGSGLRVYGGSGTNQWDMYLNGANLRFSDNTGGGGVVFDTGISALNGTFSQNSGISLYAAQNAATNSTTAIIRQLGAGGNGGQDIGLLVDIQGANDSDRILNCRYYNGSTFTSRFLVQRDASTIINGTSNTLITLDSTHSNGYTGVAINQSASNKALFGYGTWLTTDGGVAIRTASSVPFTIAIGSAVPSMTIGTTSNVLIGTTTDAGQKLQVSGTSLFTSTMTANGNFNMNKITPTIQLKGTDFGNSGAVLQLLGWAGSYRNWQISVANLVGTTGLEFTPSTTDGGSTFSTTVVAFGSNGDISNSGGITTAAPTTGTSAKWKLGSRVAAAVVLDATQYIEVEVGGTFYKLAIVT